MLPLSAGGRRYGAKRDFHDSRDYTLASAPVFRLPSPKLLPSVDLTPWCGPVKDQKDEGSCTGHAFSSLREFLARRYEKKEPILSPQYVYMQELILEGSFPRDEGAQSRSGCYVIDTMGCCEESAFPYVPGEFTKPTQAQIDNAKGWLGGAYHRLIDPVADSLSCLASNYCHSLAFAVYESFESDWKQTGVMPIPDTSKESLLGYHEVFACGYDMTYTGKAQILIQNSWGTGFGLGGRFWMPAEIVKNGNLVLDMWVPHLGRAWRPQQ